MIEQEFHTGEVKVCFHHLNDSRKFENRGKKYPFCMKKRTDTIVSNLCLLYGGDEGI